MLMSSREDSQCIYLLTIPCVDGPLSVFGISLILQRSSIRTNQLAVKKVYSEIDKRKYTKAGLRLKTYTTVSSVTMMLWQLP